MFYCNNDYYWLGFLAADGCVSSNRDAINLTLQGRDREHIVKFSRWSGCPEEDIFDDLKRCNGKEYPASGITIPSRELKKELRKYGIVERKSYKDIDFLSHIPDEFKFVFIMGYFDGDGCITIPKNVKYASYMLNFVGNKLAITSIRKYFELNCPGFTSEVRKIKKTKNTYEWNMTFAKGIKYFINNYLNMSEYCDTLDRKREKIEVAKEFFIQKDKIKKIKTEQKRKESGKSVCEKCGCEINKYTKTGMCLLCCSEGYRKVVRPDHDTLKKELEEHNFVYVGEKYGVSDNAVRKWVRYYERYK